MTWIAITMTPPGPGCRPWSFGPGRLALRRPLTRRPSGRASSGRRCPRPLRTPVQLGRPAGPLRPVRRRAPVGRRGARAASRRTGTPSAGTRRTRVSARPAPGPAGARPRPGLAVALRAPRSSGAPRLTTRRSAVLIGAAGATARRGSIGRADGDRDRGRLVGPPAKAGTWSTKRCRGRSATAPGQPGAAEPAPRVKPPPARPGEVVAAAFERPNRPSAAPAPAS